MFDHYQAITWTNIYQVLWQSNELPFHTIYQGYPAKRALAWQVGPFWQDTINIQELNLVSIETADGLILTSQAMCCHTAYHEVWHHYLLDFTFPWIWWHFSECMMRSSKKNRKKKSWHHFEFLSPCWSLEQTVISPPSAPRWRPTCRGEWQQHSLDKQHLNFDNWFCSDMISWVPIADIFSSDVPNGMAPSR